MVRKIITNLVGGSRDHFTLWFSVSPDEVVPFSFEICDYIYCIVAMERWVMYISVTRIRILKKNFIATIQFLLP